MEFATAFKIVTDTGLLVYSTVYGNGVYIAVAKPISRLRSSEKLAYLNSLGVDRFSNVLIDGVHHLERVHRGERFSMGVVCKKQEHALRSQWIQEAQKILNKQSRNTAA